MEIWKRKFGNMEEMSNNNEVFDKICGEKATVPYKNLSYTPTIIANRIHSRYPGISREEIKIIVGLYFEECINVLLKKNGKIYFPGIGTLSLVVVNKRGFDFKTNSYLLTNEKRYRLKFSEMGSFAGKRTKKAKEDFGLVSGGDNDGK